MKKKKETPRAGAVIVAAGRGSRMNMDVSKQYIEIADKPVAARTLQAFENCDYIDEIVLVINEKDFIYCKQNIVDFYGFSKVKALVAGGEERQDSVYNGLKEISNNCDIVLIHDGARPFVSEQNLINSIDAAIEFGASCVAVPVKDTIKEVDENIFINKTLQRNSLWAMQTPQTFRYDLIMKAYEEAIQNGIKVTDDAAMVECLGVKVKLVMGNYFNIKITTQEDLIMGEAIARALEL